ncbi:unnamed protein product [Phytophthora fragariaefolia]|uniref:Unnamed protein product n=1 Tax=Phytophthora fragariaefolia TaxID=1490495 RepID=A0A9W6Y1E3_9STRA|nr:unnamed protein product [Phytophthora fragariaefolia]
MSLSSSTTVAQRRKRRTEAAIAAVQELRAMERAAKQDVTLVSERRAEPVKTLLQEAGCDAGTTSKGKRAAVQERVQPADEEWIECVHQHKKNGPVERYAYGTLADMRATRKRALKGVKAFRLVKRVRRLQKKRARAEQLKQRELRNNAGRLKTKVKKCEYV